MKYGIRVFICKIIYEIVFVKSKDKDEQEYRTHWNIWSNFAKPF